MNDCTTFLQITDILSSSLEIYTGPCWALDYLMCLYLLCDKVGFHVYWVAVSKALLGKIVDLYSSELIVLL